MRIFYLILCFICLCDKEDIYSFVISCLIFLVAFIGTKKYKLNPIGMIVACGIAGLILY